MSCSCVNTGKNRVTREVIITNTLPSINFKVVTWTNEMIVSL